MAVFSLCVLTVGHLHKRHSSVSSFSYKDTRPVELGSHPFDLIYPLSSYQAPSTDRVTLRIKIPTYVLGGDKKHLFLNNVCRMEVKDWYLKHLGFPCGSVGKHPPAVQETQETQVQSLGREDPLEKEMATCSNILTWKIPWVEEPGGLQSTGLQRVKHD